MANPACIQNTSAAPIKNQNSTVIMIVPPSFVRFPGKKQETTASAKDVVVSDVRHFTIELPDSQWSNCKKFPMKAF
jgi:hypothetical protein